MARFNDARERWADCQAKPGSSKHEVFMDDYYAEEEGQRVLLVFSLGFFRR